MFIIQVDDLQHLSGPLRHVGYACPLLLQDSDALRALGVADLSKSYKSVWVLVKDDMDVSTWISTLLDQGVEKILVSVTSQTSLEAFATAVQQQQWNIPVDRLGLDVSQLPNFNLESLVKHPISVLVVPSQLATSTATGPVQVYSKLGVNYSATNVPLQTVIPIEKIFLGGDVSKISPSLINLPHLLWSTFKSDRPDGLIPTVVTDEQGVALGLCYSSEHSFEAALKTGKGVYFSRNRGLWEKGASSGASQILRGIHWDCDSDTLCFTVIQKAPGFCHLNTRTCFGKGPAISALFETLQERLSAAPQGSYTKRLFDDQALLTSKIREEAQELCDAKTKDEIAWETADLLYFALVKCVSSGVSLTDVEKHLELRAKKISRRPGNAKPQFMDVKSTTSPSEPGSSQSDNVPVVSKPQGDFGMNKVELHSLNRDQVYTLIQRPIIKTDEIMSRVRPIVEEVRAKGDAALISLTEKFDKVKLDSCVIKAPFDPSLMQISETVRKSIDLAYNNLEKFHLAQLESKPLVVETMPGVVCSRFLRPISRVGLYVPGGTAVLPSTTLHLGVPAKVAGCETIVIATPPRKDGTICPEVMYVAHKIGAAAVVKAGGAQAVAAMAFGTDCVPKVDKICGPGNQYVTAAKMIVQSDNSAMTSIDMPAGPSELLVIMDKNANPRYVVSDLLSQAEHGVDSQVVLVAVDMTTTALDAVQKELVAQASVLPRADIVRVSISKSYLVTVKTMEEALAFSNHYAPEHLILNVDNAESYVSQVHNAGSVFVGAFSPESCGDYASGTNHTLPTYGYARMYSGVNTNTFLKHITSQTLTSEGLDAIGDAVTTLAEIEGLEAHRNAVAIRLKDIRARK